MKHINKVAITFGILIIMSLCVFTNAETIANYQLNEGTTNLGTVSNLKSDDKEPGTVYSTTALFVASSTGVFQIKTSGCKECEFSVKDITSGKYLDGWKNSPTYINEYFSMIKGHSYLISFSDFVSQSSSLVVNISKIKEAKNAKVIKNMIVTKGGIIYQITKAGKKPVVKAVGAIVPKWSVTIPATIKIGKKNAQVTAIGAGMMKERELKSLTIGKNVMIIGNSAFALCDSIKKITVKTQKLKSVGSGAFKDVGSYEKTTVKVPKKMLKKYKKLLKSKGFGSKTTIK